MRRGPRRKWPKLRRKKIEPRGRFPCGSFSLFHYPLFSGGVCFDRLQRKLEIEVAQRVKRFAKAQTTSWPSSCPSWQPFSSGQLSLLSSSWPQSVLLKRFIGEIRLGDFHCHNYSSESHPEQKTHTRFTTL